MPRVRCPECDKAVKVPDDYERTSIRCPACKGKIRLDADNEEKTDAKRLSGFKLAAWSVAGAGVLLALVVGFLFAAKAWWPANASVAGNDKAVKGIVPPRKVVVNPALEKALIDLNSLDIRTCVDAAEVLAGIPPNDDRVAVVKKLSSMVQDKEPSIRKAIIKALGLWASPNDLPILIAMLGDKDLAKRNDTLPVIGRFRDERTIKPVVNCLREPATRAEANKTVRELGPMAEKEVLALLSDADDGLKVEAISVLRDIGTPQSAPALQNLAASTNVAVKGRAEEALTAIQSRVKK